jgi:hypothetical protein
MSLVIARHIASLGMAKVFTVVNIMERSSTLINKFRSSDDAQNDYPIHQLQENEGVNWIVIDNDIMHDATNSYFQQIKQPNGDIHLRLVNIYSKDRSQPAVSQ